MTISRAVNSSDLPPTSLAARCSHDDAVDKLFGWPSVTLRQKAGNGANRLTDPKVNPTTRRRRA